MKGNNTIEFEFEGIKDQMEMPDHNNLMQMTPQQSIEIMNKTVLLMYSVKM